MRRRRHGRTDIEVSVICLGCWALADDSTWGLQDRADSIATVRAALDAGKKAREASLKRLKTDYIDVCCIHWPNRKVPIAETLEATEEQVRCCGRARRPVWSVTAAKGTSSASTIRKTVRTAGVASSAGSTDACAVQRCRAQ